MVHEALRESIPAFAIGALDLEEADEVREHLRECEECGRLLLVYEPCRHALDVAAPDVATPSGFEARLVQRATGVQASSVPRQGRKWLPARLPWALTAVSLAVALLLGGRVWQLNDALTRQRTAEARVAALMAGPDVIELEMESSWRSYQGWIYMSPERDAAVVVMDGLHRLPEGSVYQIWLNAPGHKDSGGTFVPVQDGAVQVYLSPRDGLQEYESLGVTIEPEGGSPGPTTRRVIGGDL